MCESDSLWWATQGLLLIDGLVQEKIVALEEAKAGAEDLRDEALRHVQRLQHELTHAQSIAAKHEREMLQVALQDSLSQLTFTIKEELPVV